MSIKYSEYLDAVAIKYRTLSYNDLAPQSVTGALPRFDLSFAQVIELLGPYCGVRVLEQLKAGELDKREAYRICREHKSPVATVLAAGVRRWGKPVQEVEKAVVDAGERLGNKLRKYLKLFNGIATITPLLGLLGTVIGMIQSFNAIVVTGAMGKPELLAAGISQALITTAAGLTVAIPALIAYIYFSSRVDKLLMEIDEHGQQLVQAVCAERVGRIKRRQANHGAARRAA